MAINPDTALPDTPRNRGDDGAPQSESTTPAEDQRTIFWNQIAWVPCWQACGGGLGHPAPAYMLGLGIGIATSDPGTGDNPSATSLSIGAGIWWTLFGVWPPL